MAGNVKNLIPKKTLSKEEAKALGRKGGLASAEAKRRRKTLKEELLLLLEDKEIQKSVTVALIEKAKSGDTRAFEVLRDTIGEKPTEKIENSGEMNNIITVKLDGDVSEWGK